MNVNNIGNPFVLPVIFEDIQKLTLGQTLCMLPVWESLLLSSVLERYEPSHSHVTLKENKERQSLAWAVT
jgi:hypothetical protein